MKEHLTLHVMGVISVFLLLNNTVVAAKGDVKGAQDHPLISRYAGSTIIAYGQKAYDEYALLIHKAIRYGGKKKNAEATQRLEGKVTKIRYRAPEDRSTLEVFRNYQQAMEKAAFEVLFTCTDEECGGRNFNHAVTGAMYFAENYGDQRYLAAKLSRAEGDVYVSLYAVRNHSGGGPMRNRIFTKLDIIELEPMDLGLVTIDAEAMANDISKTGHVAIYGIYFDTDKADLKPASKPVLDEIAKLLKKSPNLKIFVVGHTDNVGTIEYNLTLSERRANSVVSALVSDYGIQRSRLAPKGIGYLAPLESNRTQSGRAKNRRVELVEQ
jgi:outer membrane protein OmpA-like peptidoglycan-associated protein